MLFWDFVKLHYHFIIWEMWMAYWGWFETILLLYLYGIWPSWTRDDSLPSWNVDGSFNLHFVCEIFTEDDCDHPELGMIDYHPWMWMVNSTFILCEIFTEDGCDHPVAILCMVWPSCDSSGLPYSLWYDYPITLTIYWEWCLTILGFFDNLLEIVWPFWDCSGLSYFLWYDYPINFDNLLELGCDYTRIVGDHTGIAVVLFSTEFFLS